MVHEYMYSQIRNEILLWIKQKRFMEGDKLPSESQLMELFGCSRLTVRNALAPLEKDKIIVRKQGKGCFVAKPPFEQPINEIHSYTQTIRNAGMTPHRKIISCGIAPATESEAAMLLIPKAEEVYHLERIIFADDKALCLTKAVLPAKYLAGIEKYNFENASLYETLKKEYNITISGSEIHMEATLAGKTIGEQLSLPASAPLLLYESTAYTKMKEETVPIEYCLSWYNTKTIKYTLSKNNG